MWTSVTEANTSAGRSIVIIILLHDRETSQGSIIL
jgi:hypothetical protein